MANERFPLTTAQRWLVNIGMFIQFHLVAIGLLFVWWVVFYNFAFMGEGFASGIFFWFIIPFCFGCLLSVYIFFRLLLAYTNFDIALTIMIMIDVCFAVFMGTTIIVPVYLAMPIVLYSIALYSFAHTPRKNMESNDAS